MKVSYRQPKWFGDQIIELHDRHVAIKTRLGGETKEAFVWLRDLHPKSVRTGRRFIRLAFGPAVLAVLCAWGVKAILNQDSLPHDLIAFPGMFGIAFLWYVYVGMQPVLTFEFRDRQDQVAVSIYGPKGQKYASQDFAAAIEKAIEGDQKTAEPGELCSTRRVVFARSEAER
jgi:hypothetical protein